MGVVNKLRKEKALQRKVFLYLLYFLTALFIFAFIKYPGLISEQAGVVSVADFTGYKPFMYRVLMPSLIRVIEFVTPAFIKDKVDFTLKGILERRLKITYPFLTAEQISRVSKFGYRITVYMLLNISFLFLFLISLRSLALAMADFRRNVSDLLPIGMAVILPTYFDYSNMFYDFPHLFLFTTGLLLLYKKRWDYYLAFFILAILNKETSALLIVVFAINYYSILPRKTFYKLLGLQVGLFILIKLFLYLIFVGNPGVFASFTFHRNLEHLAILANYFRFEQIDSSLLFPAGLNIPLPRGINLPVFVIVALVVFYKWSEKPLFLRKSAVNVIIIFPFGLMMGYIDELRAYYSVVPIVYLLGVSGIVKMTKNFRVIKS